MLKQYSRQVCYKAMKPNENLVQWTNEPTHTSSPQKISPFTAAAEIFTHHFFVSNNSKCNADTSLEKTPMSDRKCAMEKFLYLKFMCEPQHLSLQGRRYGLELSGVALFIQQLTLETILIQLQVPPQALG